VLSRGNLLNVEKEDTGYDFYINSTYVRTLKENHFQPELCIFNTFYSNKKLSSSNLYYNFFAENICYIHPGTIYQQASVDLVLLPTASFTVRLETTLQIDPQQKAATHIQPN
jgi:hypothetical protein